jgi:hypothetical protein
MEKKIKMRAKQKQVGLHHSKTINRVKRQPAE